MGQVVVQQLDDAVGQRALAVSVRWPIDFMIICCETLARFTATEESLRIRSWVPADVVLAPAHARQLRQAREAAARLAARDPEVATADLGRYDTLAEVAS